MGNIQAIEVQIPAEHDAWGGGSTTRIAPGQHHSRVLPIFSP